MQAFLQQKKKGETEQIKETGHFVPRDARVEVAQELKRSHFILGSDQSDFRSKNEVAQQDQNWNIDQEERRNYDKFSKQIRQSHVQIGMNNKTNFQTSNVQDYDRKSVDQGRIQAAIETKQDLRKAHFSFGSVSMGSDNFLTTNMERFRKSIISSPSELRPQMNNGPDKIKSAGNRILQSNSKPNYQSSMKESMVQHDLLQSYKNLQQQQEQGKNLRKHHFQFGFESATALQSEYQNFQQDRAKSVPFQPNTLRTLNEIKRSNIEIGNRWQGTDYTTMTKQIHQGGAINTNRDEVINTLEAARDLRKSHFQVGNSAQVTESSAKSAFQNHGVTNETQKQKEAIQSKMQTGNFKIGDDKANGSYITSYKQSIIPSDKLQDAMKQTDEKKHLQGSINLGSHHQDYVSEAKSKFLKVTGESDKQTKLLIEKNRAPHFQFGDGQTHELTSVAKSQFDFKGKAAEIRGYLDESKKADLKQHHFSMGSHSTEYQTSAQKQFNQDQLNSNNNNATASNGLKFESKSLLKNSGQRIFGGNQPQGGGSGGNGDFQTINQSYIKWIQPAPTQINMNMGGPSGQADHSHQVTLSNSLQYLLKKLFLVVLKEEKLIEQQRQILAKLDEQFDPCLSFHNFANKQTNCISSVDLHKYLRNFGLDEINEVDCEIICNYFSARQDGRMDLQDFIQMILPCDNAKLRKKIDKKPKYLVSKDEPISREVEVELIKLIEMEISLNRKQEEVKQKIHSCKDFSEERAFLAVDDWNYGYIDKSNLRNFLRKHGYNATTADILKIIRRMDLDGDARLSRQEFYEAIQPFEPFSKLMFSNKQVDSIRTMAQDRILKKNRQSTSPLKKRPILDHQRIKRGNQSNKQALLSLDSGYRSRSSNQIPEISNNIDQDQQINLVIQYSDPKLQNQAQQPIKIYENEPLIDQALNQSESQQMLLKELEARFLDNQENKKSLSKESNQKSNQKVQFHENQELRQPLQASINDYPKEFEGNQNIKNDSALKDSRINSTFQGDSSTLTSSPLRVRNLNYTGSSIKKSSFKNEIQEQSPFASDYHSLRGNYNLTNNYQKSDNLRYKDPYLRYSQITESNYLDKISQIDYNETQRLMTRHFQEFIYMEQETEDLKIKLALKQDFNLMDAFGFLDQRGRGFLDQLELRDILYSLRPQDYNIGHRYTIDEVDMLFERFNKQVDGKLRYTDFSKMIMPIDQYYAKMQSLKRVQFPLNQRNMDRETLTIFIRLIDLMINNEIKAENIRRDIYSRYRLNMRSLFQLLDSEYDGYLTYSELSSVFRECNKHLSMSDYEYLRNRLDQDADGKISFEEVRLMK